MKTDVKHDDIAVSLMMSDGVKYSQITKKSSAIFNIFIMLLNILILTLVVFACAHNNTDTNLLTVFGNIRWEYILLIFAILILVLMLNVVPDSLLLYSKSKKVWFWRLLVDNIKISFFNQVTLCSTGGYSVSSVCLKNRGVEDKVSVDVSRSKKITNLIAVVLYSFLVVTIGSYLYFKNLNIIFFVATVVCFLILCIRLLFTLFIDKNRSRGVAIISGICKLLYKLRIIKDFDALYKKIINEIVVANRALRSNGKIIATQIITQIVGLFLKQFILYIILLMLNFDISGMFFEVLTVVSMFHVIISVWPLPAGTLVYEVLFVVIFNHIFLEGYVVWSLILYRLFTYYFPIVCRYVIVLLEKLCLKKDLHDVWCKSFCYVDIESKGTNLVKWS